MTKENWYWDFEDRVLKVADAEQAKQTGCELCGDKILSRGLCNRHYKSERKAGRLPIVIRPKVETLVDAFAWYMPGDPPELGCWDWSANTDDDGYGVFSWGTGNMRAHRAAYEIFKGGIPEDLLVRHICDRPVCVQPVHLLVGTNDENMQDMVDRERAVRGTDHHNAKLTPELVREIRHLHASGQGKRPLGRQFGVSDFTIHQVVERITWRHVS